MINKHRGFGVTGAIIAGFILVVTVTAYSAYTHRLYEERKARIEKMFIDARHVVWALGKYYESNCVTGPVSVSSLVGSYLDASYNESTYAGYSLSISTSGTNVIGNVSFPVSLDDAEVAKKLIVDGASMNDGTLSYSRVVSSIRNSRDTLINNVVGITSPGGC